MKKYIYFMTSNSHWFDLAVKLKENKIAEPILWMGDHNHLDRARELFGSDVVKDFDFFKFKSHKILKDEYHGKFNDFFTSDNYLIAKDRSLKMMDRIDDLAVMSRLDREAVFNMTVIWALSKFEKILPDLLISVENPHTHIHYTILQICKFLNIESVKFNAWTPLPLLSLRNAINHKPININKKLDEKNIQKFSKEIDNYVDNIYQRSEIYKTSHTEIERLESQKTSWKIEQIIKFIKDTFRKYKSKNHYLESRDYDPLNPFKFNTLKKLKIIKRRKTNLIKALNHSVSNEINLSKKFIYFGLHYEPEKTTLPDGGIFHDQFLAILKLREFVPKDIKIYVKEHPSMFYDSLYGFRGRSPLFYRLLKNINNIEILGTNHKTLDLIDKSIFTATITGTLGIESAILGKKSIIFGESWFSGCPNTFNWSEDLNYYELKSKEILSKTHISNFLKEKLRDESLIGLLNSRSSLRFKKYINDDFFINQSYSIYESFKNYFNSK